MDEWWQPFKVEPRRLGGPSSLRQGQFEELLEKCSKRKALRYVSRMLNKETKWSRIPKPTEEALLWMKEVYPLVYGLDNTEVIEAMEMFYGANSGIDEEEDLVQSGKVLRESADVVMELVEYITNDKKKITKEGSNFLLPRIFQLKSMIDDSLQALAKREAELIVLEKTQTIELPTQTKAGVPKVTFAQALGSKGAQKGKSTEVGPPKRVILAYPDKDQTSDVTKKQIQEKCQPMEEGWKIKNFRKVRGGGVLIEAGDDRTLDRIKKSIKLKDLGLKLEEPRKRGPKVIIYDVPRTEDNDNFLNRLWQQNMQDTELDKEEILKKTTIRLRTGKHKDVVNLVIEGPASLRHALIGQETVYVGFSACKARDFLVPMRCYKCQQYGHMSKSCKGKDLCSKCGDEGHAHKDCKSPENDKCSNCKHDGKDHNHRVDSKKCPHYEKAFQMEIEKTDYGQ